MSGSGESIAAPRIPAEPGIWVLVGGDLLVFSLFFLSFATYRRDAVELYASAQAQVGHGIGIANTLLLLTGSWFVYRGVEYARRDGPHAGANLLLMGALTGVAFLLNKAVEWSTLFAQGASAYENDYFMFFFMFTGIHAFHVLLGTGVLLAFQARMREGAARSPSMWVIEAGGIFWHLVDLLWLVLFALLYLA